ncbi:DNA independent RNA polymerase I transcription factor [Rhizina undulata]
MLNPRILQPTSGASLAVEKSVKGAVKGEKMLVSPAGLKRYSPSEMDIDTDSDRSSKKIRIVGNLQVDDARSRDLEAGAVFGKFVGNALDEKAAGNSTRYEELRRKFSTDPTDEAAPSSSELKRTIVALTQVVSRLNSSSAPLVKDIVGCQWAGRDNLFVGAYVRLLGNLVSAHANYMGIVTKMLVGHLGALSSSIYKLPGHMPVARSTVYDRAHFALQFILDLVPTAAFSTLFPALVEEFPHKSEKKLAHTCYLMNLLRVIEYAPSLKNKVLGMITDRVIKIDIEIQVDLDELEDDEGEELEAELNTEKIKDIVDDESLEEEDSDSDGDAEYDDDDDDSNAVANIKETVDKLDSMLEILFRHFENNFPETPVEEPGRQSIDTFDLLLRMFETTVLPTYRSRYTQFLIFWAAQKSPQFSDQFCVSVLEKALDNSRPQGARQAAAAYVASFVARAKFMPQKDVRAVVRIMCRWLGEFVDLRSMECKGPDVARWGGFYSVCQAVMYIFCFRWRDLREEDEDEFGVAEEVWISGLEVLSKVVTSRFNPLKVCSPAVVETFAKITNHLQFLFCYTIIEQNKRTAIGVGGELDSYFPFDPYNLSRSRKWIDGYYVEWQPVEGLEDDNSSAESDESDVSDVEETEDEEESESSED